jgi:protein SCO1/2
MPFLRPMRLRRRLMLSGAAGLLLASCDGRAPAFRNTDVTGADFGKGFELTDHWGQTRRLEDFRGKVLAVFFGFTHCPDVCPSTLAEMAEVMARLGPRADQLQVVFITVDPERDTQALLAEYVPAFHPSFIGLRGDLEATARTAKSFRVFFQKVKGKTPESYTIDHTAGSYIYDRTGRLRLFVRHGAGADPILADVRRLLDER